MIGDKFKMAVIGKTIRPMCFYKKGEKTNLILPCIYFSQKSAWMDTRVFNEWFRCFIAFLIEKYPPGKHYLNVDNFSGHVPDHDNDTVKIQYLPPNTTSVDQVCDQGIIRSLQVFYKYDLLNTLADYEQVGLPGLFKPPKLRDDPGRGRRGIKDGRMPNVMDAMELLTRAWEKVSDVSIIKCWKKTNLYSPYHIKVVDAILAKRGRPDYDPTLESKLPLSTTLDLKVKLETLTIPKYADVALKRSLQELRDVSCQVDQVTFCDLFHRFLNIHEDFREDTLCEDIISEVNSDFKEKEEEEEMMLEEETGKKSAIPTKDAVLRQENALTAMSEAFGTDHALVKKVQNELMKTHTLRRQHQTDIRQFVGNNNVVIQPSTFNIFVTPTKDIDEDESNMSDDSDDLYDDCFVEYNSEDKEDDVDMQEEMETNFSQLNLYDK